jgi:hypothetical protein
MNTADVARQASKQCIVLADWEVPYEISRHRFPDGQSGSVNGEVWHRNFIYKSVTYQHCEYAIINPYLLGIRREVVRCTVNGVDMTQANSVWTCDETEGSWFFDPISNRGYVRPKINLPFDKVFTHDFGTDNWLDETDDAASATPDDIEMKAAANDEHYLGMFYSRFTWWKLTFDTLRAGGTSSFLYWDGSAYVDIDADIVWTSGNVNLTAAENIGHWTDPQGDWTRQSTLGDITGQTPTGQPTAFWIQINNDSIYSTPGFGNQFFVAPVLEESIVIFWLGMPLGNKYVHIDGKNYLGRLVIDERNTTSDQSSKNTDAIQEAMIGASVTGDGGNISISNADGLFDSLIERLSSSEDEEILLGGHVNFRLGYNTPDFEMPIADYLQFRRATTEGVSWIRPQLGLSLMNETLKMDVNCMQSFLTVADYRNMSPDQEGKAIPIYFGNTETLGVVDATPEERFARWLKGFVVKPGDPVGSGWVGRGFKFGAQILNPETGTLHGWYDIPEIMEWKTNRPIPIAQNEWDLLEGNTRVNFNLENATPVTGEIRASVMGVADDAIGTFTGTPGNVIAHPLHIIRFLLICICKYKSSDLYLPSFIEAGDTIGGIDGEIEIPAAYADNSSVYIDNASEKAITVINRLLTQMFAILQPDNDGLLRISTRKAISGGGGPTTSTPVILSHQVRNQAILHDTTTMASNVNVMFRQHPSTGHRTSVAEPEVAVIENSVGNELFINTNFSKAYLNYDNLITFETYMTDLEKVQALREVLYKWLRRGPRTYRLDDVYGMTMAALLGGSVLLRWDRSLDGELQDKQVWLITSERKYGRHGVILECLEAAK